VYEFVIQNIQNIFNAPELDRNSQRMEEIAAEDNCVDGRIHGVYVPGGYEQRVAL